MGTVYVLMSVCVRVHRGSCSPLHQRGWAPLPESPDELPWTTGPLHPSSATFTATAAGTLTLSVPRLVFAVMDVE